MKKQSNGIFHYSALAVAAVALWAGSAQADTLLIPGLYNTGVVSVGVSGTTLVADGVADSHWTVEQGSGSFLSAYGASASGSGVLSNPPADGGTGNATYWIGSNNPSGQTSSWISSTSTHTDTAGSTYYDYREYFNLSGYNLNTLKISGVWASDNQLQQIGVNGHLQSGDSITSAYNTATQQRTSLHGFTLAALSGYFAAGSNYIDFILTNSDLTPQIGSVNPTGVRVEFSASVDAPATLSLLGLGVAALGALRRRKA